jgi:hypothetical protein
MHRAFGWLALAACSLNALGGVHRALAGHPLASTACSVVVIVVFGGAAFRNLRRPFPVRTSLYFILATAVLVIINQLL